MTLQPRLTIASLFVTLRNHLHLAREQKNHDELQKLFGTFILIGDAAIEVEDETVIELAETFTARPDTPGSRAPASQASEPN